jgi:hypothetical protein
MMQAHDPFSTSQISMLLQPSDWAGRLLTAGKQGWSVSPTMTEVAMRLTGDIGRDHLPKAIPADRQEDDE